MGRLMVAGAALVLMAGAAHAASDHFHVTPAEHAACDADAVRLCADSYPDEDQLFACMKQKVDQLTPVCATTFRAGVKRRHLEM